MNTTITGIPEFQRLLSEVGRAPAKALTAATKKGANIMRQAAIASAPKLSGKLKKGIRLFSEKRKTGKKVYQIAFNRNMNNVFVKISRAGKRSYYPASQEYGFKLKNGGKKTGRYFMKRAFVPNKRIIEQTMIDELTNSLRNLR